MTRIFFDDEIRAHLSVHDAIRWMGEAIDEHHESRMESPARVAIDLAGPQLILTTGRLKGSWYGYRAYGFATGPSAEQVVVVHDETSGVVRAVSVGNELGPRRTGAIGGVAADTLASPRATTMAIIGTGPQALTQLWAISAVRPLQDVKVFSRDEVRREAFVQRAASVSSSPCRSVSSAREALRGADIVVLATTSLTPVIDTHWLEPNAYVTTLGPKQCGRSEFAADLTTAAIAIVTDSLAQIDAYDPPSVLIETSQRARVTTLGRMRADQVEPLKQGITLFFSVGLAGTEVYLLDQLAKSVEAAP